MSFLCSLPLISALLTGCDASGPIATGYVEGDFVLVAPVETAQVREVKVARGDVVEAGAVLVEMERQDAEIALAQAEANVAQAESQLADLKEGARPEEIRVIEANLASAELRAQEAARERDRMQELSNRGVVTVAERDQAVTAAQVANAEVAQVAAQLAVAELPARPQAIAQAEAAVEAAKGAREQAQWRLDQRTLSLGQPVKITDIVRNAGEIAGPASPVLAVLPEGAVKLRLYIPETAYSLIEVGDLLAVACDGCPDGQRARISYIADEPEFTPPVIYSQENRQQLVFLLEAVPEGAHALKPGQIVDVTLAEDGA